MEEKYLDYVITGLLILIVVALVITASKKVHEDFTELYFDDHTNLQKYPNQTVNFSFAIHNMENKQYEYEVVVSEEAYYNANEPYKTIELNRFKVALENNETRIFSQQFDLPLFDKIKLKVSIKNETQDIHFWAFHANESYKYDYGYGLLDCLKTAEVQQFNEIEIDARADYANAWPQMQVWLDGKPVSTITVESNQTGAYFLQLNGTKGMHVLDIAFINDYYNSTSKEDRNLYIEKVIINSVELNSQNLTRDSGSKEAMFDCQQISNTGTMYSSGAIRVKLGAW